MVEGELMLTSNTAEHCNTSARRASATRTPERGWGDYVPQNVCVTRCSGSGGSA